ncbi:MAG: DUF1343 domain-containing protein [Planctomycetaceae bacterium]|nr:DUF1343 domain-containing protein [Planctomycetaceae bacterium]
MIRLGLERCLADPPAVLRGSRFGLLLNQASVDGRFRYACDLLAERLPGQLVALFAPQHGLWSEQQANMIESVHDRYPPLDLPVHSLYSETRRPTLDMLKGLDALVIDLQDVGTRIYTFVWTMRECLRACAAAGVAVVVLDRPNPLGGEIVEGPLLAAGYESFVGNATIPMRHGLTLGELARLFNDEQRIGADLHVILMDGWRREMLFPDTGRAWVAPSPNMPRFETAVVYPGQVLLEGVNLSEGRGTTLPFEIAGAPWLDPWRLADEMQRRELPGLTVRPLRFVPTFDKHRGVRCGGVSFHVTDPRAVRSMAVTLALLDASRRLAPAEFAWLPPPYEYETVKPPIDILFGSDRLRRALDSGRGLPDDAELTAFDETAWRERTAACRLYA